MNSFKNGYRIGMKTVSMVLMCLFCINTISFSDVKINTLSPQLVFSDPVSSAEIRAALISELIEKRANEWQGKRIEQIYVDDMLLWLKSTEPLFEGISPALSVDKTEITIDIPGSNIRIRYYDADPKKNKTLLSGTNWTKTRTDVVAGTINRQILHITKVLPGEDVSIKNIGAVIFDWDNTIVMPAAFDEKAQVDLLAHIISGGNPTAGDHEYALGFRKDWMARGISTTEALGNIISEAEKRGKIQPGEWTIEKAVELKNAKIRKNFDMIVNDGRQDEIIVPGVKQLLDRFKKMGIPMYVISRGTKSNKLYQAERLGFSDYFEEILVDPDLDKERAIKELMTKHSGTVFMVGDHHISDMKAAKRAGAVAVGFAANVEIANRLKKEGVDALIVEDYTDIDFIERTFRGIASREAGSKAWQKMLNRPDNNKPDQIQIFLDGLTSRINLDVGKKYRFDSNVYYYRRYGPDKEIGFKAEPKKYKGVDCIGLSLLAQRKVYDAIVSIGNVAVIRPLDASAQFELEITSEGKKYRVKGYIIGALSTDNSKLSDQETNEIEYSHFMNMLKITYPDGREVPLLNGHGPYPPVTFTPGRSHKLGNYPDRTYEYVEGAVADNYIRKYAGWVTRVAGNEDLIKQMRNKAIGLFINIKKGGESPWLSLLYADHPVEVRDITSGDRAMRRKFLLLHKLSHIIFKRGESGEMAAAMHIDIKSEGVTLSFEKDDKIELVLSYEELQIIKREIEAGAHMNYSQSTGEYLRWGQVLGMVKNNELKDRARESEFYQRLAALMDRNNRDDFLRIAGSVHIKNEELVSSMESFYDEQYNSMPVEVKALKINTGKVRVAFSLSKNTKEKGGMHYDKINVYRKMRDGSEIYGDKDPNSMRDDLLTLDEHAGIFQEENPDNKIIAYSGWGNIIMDGYLAGYQDGEVIIRDDEEPGRTYFSAIIFSDGHIEFRDIRYENNKPVDANSSEILSDVDEGIQIASGQPVLKYGNTIKSSSIYKQFDNIKHLFHLPFLSEEGRTIHFGVDQLKADKGKFRDAAEGKSVTLRLEAFQTSPDKDVPELKPVPVGVLLNGLKEKGYSNKGINNAGEIKNRGEFFIDEGNGTITISFYPALNAHHFIGIDDDGNFLDIIVQGRSNRTGINLEEAGEWLKEKYNLRSAIVIDNGADPMLNYKGDLVVPSFNGRTKIASAIIYSINDEKTEEKPDKTEINVKKLTKEYAAKHIKRLLQIQGAIYGDKWKEEQFLSDEWKDGEWGRSGDRRFNAKWERSVVAVNSKDEPVGFILAYERHKDEEMQKVGKRSLYIHQLAIDSKYQGNGLGKMLVHEVAKNLVKRNFMMIEKDEDPVITLKLDQHAAYLKKVYTKMGFKLIDKTVTKFEYEDDHEDYIYAGSASEVLEKTVKSRAINGTKEKIEAQYSGLLESSKLLVSTLLTGRDEILLRVPIETIEFMDQGDIQSFFDTFQHKNSNGYIELFYASGGGAVNEKTHKMYGLRKRPSDFKPEKGNTITLMPVFKGEISSKKRQARRDIEYIVKTRTGGLDYRKTQIAPIGFQNDSTGLIRGALFGLVMVHVAREKNDGLRLDESLMRNQFVRSMLGFYGPREIESVNLTSQDIVDLATGGINRLVPVLRKLIELLPIEPIDARQIFENVRQIWLAA